MLLAYVRKCFLLAVPYPLREHSVWSVAIQMLSLNFWKAPRLLCWMHFRFDHVSFHLKRRRRRRKKSDILIIYVDAHQPLLAAWGWKVFKGRWSRVWCSVWNLSLCRFPVSQEGNSCCRSCLFRELITVLGTLGIYPDGFAGRHLTFHDDPSA